VKLETLTSLAAVGEKSVELSCVYTGNTRELLTDHVVMVTSREPNDALYTELCEEIDIARVGDCSAPGIIAAAVMAGQRIGTIRGFLRPITCKLTIPAGSLGPLARSMQPNGASLHGIARDRLGGERFHSAILAGGAR
jgi:hypothetical protein